MAGEGNGFQIGQRVLVHGRYAGTIHYGPGEVKTMEGIWYGIVLNRRVGTTSGTIDGHIYFHSPENQGIFVREGALQKFSAIDAAVCTIQNLWRRYAAIKMFKGILNAVTWNILDNKLEQLMVRRGVRLRPIEVALGDLAQSQHQLEMLHSENKLVQVDEKYEGPHLKWPLTLDNVLDMMEHFQQGRCLHYSYVLEVLKRASVLMDLLPNVQNITLHEGRTITIVGDIHGQLEDLYTIFSKYGLPSRTNMFLFNGDFIDRGENGTEVVITMLVFKLLYPNSVYLNRGNHESRQQSSMMGFETEISVKYDGHDENDPYRHRHVFMAFQSLFDTLPLCALIHSRIFVCHGGLFSDEGVTVNHINLIRRRREPPLDPRTLEELIFQQLLWSDPRKIIGSTPSRRGAGIHFGRDVTQKFCERNNLYLIVRSHECVDQGYDIIHGDRLITIFSASYYCGNNWNRGAVLRIDRELKPQLLFHYASELSKIKFGEVTSYKMVPHKKKQNGTTAPTADSVQKQQLLLEDNVRMIAERICDERPALYWYFTQHDREKSGKVSRLVWSEALHSVLKLDVPFLNLQEHFVDADDQGMINYSRYRIENSTMNNTGWHEDIISKICKKLYVAMGAWNIQQAFKTFDTDENGFIEYDEFLSTLKKLDTGLSDQQVYELMRTADENEDGRIDFREFIERFELIFTKVKKHHHDEDASSTNGPEVGEVDESESDTSKKRNKESSNPVSTMDEKTMLALQAIGKAIVSSQTSLSDLFVKFDTNQDGVLQRDEFYVALRELGFEFTDEEKQKLMAAIDVDQGNTIDYNEFVDAFSVCDKTETVNLNKGVITWQQSILQQVDNFFFQYRNHICKVLQQYDEDNTGMVTKEDFQTGITMLNDMLDSPLSKDQVAGLLDHLDKKKDGVLKYREFLDGFQVVDTKM